MARGAGRELLLAQRRLDRVVLAAREAEHVLGDLLHAGRAESRARRRHDAAAAVEDAGHQGLTVPGIEPVAIGEIGSADHLVALAARAMARGAVVDEQAM